MAIKRYESGFRVNVRDSDGNWFKQRSFDTLKAAKAYEAECLLKKKAGERAVTRTDRGITLDQYFHEKWKDVFRTNMSAGWRTDQERYWKLHIAPELGHLPFVGIEPEHVGKFLTKMRDEKELGPQMRIHLYNILKKIFDDDLLTNKVRKTANPVLKKFRAKIPKKEASYWKPEESWTLLNAFRDHKHGPAMWIMLCAGLRIGEMQALRWSDLDFETGEIILKRQWVRKEKRFGPVKGRQETRIPMLGPLLSYLKEKRPAEFAAEDFILPGANLQKVISHASIHKSLKHHAAKLELKPLSAHGFRHSCSALWVRLGSSRTQIKILLNHADEASTKTYMHDDKSELDAIIDGFKSFDQIAAKRPRLRLVAGQGAAAITPTPSS